MSQKTEKNPIKAAAAQVAKPGFGIEKPSKRVVTLYLDQKNYLRMQELHGRQVGKVIDELISAYLGMRE